MMDWLGLLYQMIVGVLLKYDRFRVSRCRRIVGFAI
jgi:hypothetical protein